MKLYSGNQAFLRDLNLISALKQVRTAGLISRAELADQLGLNRSTITTIINELLNRKLVREIGAGASKGGRPPTLLQFNTDAAYTVCVDWGSSQIKIYITDLGGKILDSKSMRHNGDQPTEQIHKVIQVISESIHQLPPNEFGILGVCLCVPGVIDNGMVGSHESGWRQLPLLSSFAEYFDCPIIIDSDANAGLVAENYYGAAIGEKNFCYIRLGRELNAAFLLGGEIYRGNDGFAGRISHVAIESNGRKCSCGNRGCWVTYVSEKALVQRYLEMSGEPALPAEFGMNQFVQLVKENDPSAIRTIHEWTEYLGIGVANLVNLLNPTLVIVDNPAILQIEEIVNKPLHSVLQQRILRLLKRNNRVLFSQLGENAIPLGAAALVIDHVFSIPSIKNA